MTKLYRPAIALHLNENDMLSSKKGSHEKHILISKLAHLIGLRIKEEHHFCITSPALLRKQFYSVRMNIACEMLSAVETSTSEKPYLITDIWEQFSQSINPSLAKLLSEKYTIYTLEDFHSEIAREDHERERSDIMDSQGKKLKLYRLIRQIKRIIENKRRHLR